MRFSTIVLLAAASVSAHPSGGHGHFHRALHEKKDAVIVTATINNEVVSWTQGAGSPFKAAHKPTTTAEETTAAATSTAAAETKKAAGETKKAAAAASSSKTSSSAAAASSSDSSSSASQSGASTYEAFATCSSKKRATAAQIAYTGNTGCGNYGSNIKLVQDSIADKYNYVITAKNEGSSSMECKIWNKIGPDGGINGFYSGNEADNFTLASNSHQKIAFASNTQGGMCCHADSIPLTADSQFNCAWLEFDFGNESNGGWSGFDASALVEASAGTGYTKLTSCTENRSPQTCSSLDGNGGGENAYLAGDEADDGTGGNLIAGDLFLTATWS